MLFSHRVPDAAIPFIKSDMRYINSIQDDSKSDCTGRIKREPDVAAKDGQNGIWIMTILLCTDLTPSAVEQCSEDTYDCGANLSRKSWRKCQIILKWNEMDLSD